MRCEVELEQALYKLRKELEKDPAYKYTWQANIAVQFQDELARRGYKLPDLYEASNVAAKNFLSVLIGDLKKD